MKTCVGPTGTRTRDNRFKVCGANHYTMGPFVSFYAFAHTSKDIECLQTQVVPTGIEPVSSPCKGLVLTTTPWNQVGLMIPPDILPKDVGTSLFLVDTDKLFWAMGPQTPDEGLEPSTTSLKG